MAKLNILVVEDDALSREVMADNLAGKGIDKQMILEQSIITPSCGTGLLEVADGEKVFQTLRLVSEALRAKHGF